ncbi:MAG: hypothetical protein ACI4V7_10390 [Succinivibrionaceae bacterium]
MKIFKNNVQLSQNEHSSDNIQIEENQNVELEDLDYNDDYENDDYFDINNIILRHPDKRNIIKELYKEFDEEIIEDILFDLDKDD